MALEDLALHVGLRVDQVDDMTRLESARTFQLLQGIAKNDGQLLALTVGAMLPKLVKAIEAVDGQNSEEIENRDWFQDLAAAQILLDSVVPVMRLRVSTSRGNSKNDSGD